MKVILGAQLYNQTELAILLGISTATVRKYVKQGKIRTTLIGGRKYISEEELRRFLNILPPQGEAAAPTTPPDETGKE